MRSFTWTLIWMDFDDAALTDIDRQTRSAFARLTRFTRLDLCCTRSETSHTSARTRKAPRRDGLVALWMNVSWARQGDSQFTGCEQASESEAGLSPRRGRFARRTAQTRSCHLELRAQVSRFHSTCQLIRAHDSQPDLNAPLDREGIDVLVHAAAAQQWCVVAVTCCRRATLVGGCTVLLPRC